MLSGLFFAPAQPARALSGGTRRKLSAALALVGSPSLLLLDEPSTGLDPFARRGLWSALAAATAGPGRSMVLTTHIMEEASALCPRLGILVKGRLTCVGTPQQLRSRHGSQLVFEVRAWRAALSAAIALDSTDCACPHRCCLRRRRPLTASETSSSAWTPARCARRMYLSFHEGRIVSIAHTSASAAPEAIVKRAGAARVARAGAAVVSESGARRPEASLPFAVVPSPATDSATHGCRRCCRLV